MALGVARSMTLGVQIRGSQIRTFDRPLPSLSPKCLSTAAAYRRMPIFVAPLDSWTDAELKGRRMYSKKVHDHFFNPRNSGAFDMKDPKNRDSIGTAVVGKAACGDVIKLQVKIEEGKITDARFKAFGCGSAIASSSYATELIKGKTCDEALKLRNTDIAEHLSLPPVKYHCSLLAEDAVKHAIGDYLKKQKSKAVEAKLD